MLKSKLQLYDHVIDDYEGWEESRENKTFTFLLLCK
jgi:hypothetical protein